MFSVSVINATYKNTISANCFTLFLSGVFELQSNIRNHLI